MKQITSIFLEIFRKPINPSWKINESSHCNLAHDHETKLSDQDTVINSLPNADVKKSMKIDFS